MSIVELKEINFIYGKKTPYAIKALDGINLEIEQGCITGIIGHTGSGKSTMIQLLNGLVRADSGVVYVDGKDIWEKPKEISKIRFCVGMVMQYPEYQLFADTVREDIAFGPKNMGLDEKEIESRITESLEFCGLKPDVLDKSPFDLSGGQKRRVALAGVMAMKPKILVLDEPAAGLDPKGRREILGGIKEYQRKSGTAVIIVSHSMEDMAMYCDRAIVMSHGKIVTHGTCGEVFSQHNLLLSVGLDVPEITGVVLKLKELGISLPNDIYTVDGAVQALKAVYANLEKERGAL